MQTEAWQSDGDESPEHALPTPEIEDETPLGQNPPQKRQRHKRVLQQRTDEADATPRVLTGSGKRSLEVHRLSYAVRRLRPQTTTFQQ